MLPYFTTLRRTEYADNFTLFHGHHMLQFGGAVVLCGNDTASHTFLPGRLVFGSLPGGFISPELADATINPLQARTSSDANQEDQLLLLPLDFFA